MAQSEKEGRGAGRVESKAYIRTFIGATLLRMAQLYPTLLRVILEIVQNALDKDVAATRVWINLDYQKRNLYVRDNGRGASVERFNSALESVAEEGRKGEGTLGRWAIGLVSPLGKCKRFTFTSCPEPQAQQYKEWRFECEQIIASRLNPPIPVTSRPNLIFDAPPKTKGVTRVDWRSEMALFEITDDKLVSKVDMDVLVGAIQSGFGNTMRRNKAKIDIKIVREDGTVEERHNVMAPKYTGRPLPERVYSNIDSGAVKFRLYVAKPSGGTRKGKVNLGVDGDDFRFDVKYIRQFAERIELSDEVYRALASGFFEGEIIGEKVKLHPNRRAFEHNDALIGFCCCLEEWWANDGSVYLRAAKEQHQEERWQTLGLRSMRVLEQLLKLPQYEYLAGVLEQFGKGTIGDGHVDVPGTEGEQDTPSVSTTDGGKKTPTGEPPRERDKPTKEHKEHKPFSVQGPNGRRRSVVKLNSLGLQLVHEAMEGSPELWKLDTKQGILTLNIRHPLWVKCDERSDSAVMKLQEFVAIQALTLYALPDGNRESQRQFGDELTPTLMLWLLDADRIRNAAGEKAAPKE